MSDGPASLEEAVPQKQQISPTLPVNTIGNPAPLGLCSFALTTFCLSLYNTGAGVSTGQPGPNGIITGLALFYGGAAQFAAGMWEFAKGNTFAATAFTSYGAFWLSFATILIPGSGVISSYKADIETLEHHIGIYLASWTIYTFIMFLGTFRLNIGLLSLFGFLTLTFLFLTLGKFIPVIALTQAGGVLGIITAFIAWICGLSGLLTNENSYFTIPLGNLNRSKVH